METLTPAIGVEKSGDLKLSTDRSVSATWVSQGSCPDYCSLKGSGCYAENGRSAIHTSRLNLAQAKGQFTPEQLARFEAQAIDNLSGKNPLRLHIVGDSRTRKSVRIVRTAAERYKARFNQPVWTFTHAINIPRELWGSVSVLRSCENFNQVKTAHAEGYASALVITEKHESHKPVQLGDGFRGIPCPQQVKKSDSCKSCKLCWNDKHLHQNKLVILFAPDRGTDKKLKSALKVLPMVNENKIAIAA